MRSRSKEKTKGWRLRQEQQQGRPSAKLRRRDEPAGLPAASPSPVAQAKLVPASKPAPIGKNTSPVSRRDYRVPLAEMDDLHVKTIHVLGGSGISRVEIARRGGPVPSTLSNWENHRVRRPALSTVRAALKACGYKLAILDPEGHEL